MAFGFVPPGYTAIWAKRNENGKLIWACHCNCHEGQARPPAEEAMLCHPCADEAFTPWIEILEAIL